MTGSDHTLTPPAVPAGGVRATGLPDEMDEARPPQPATGNGGSRPCTSKALAGIPEQVAVGRRHAKMTPGYVRWLRETTRAVRAVCVLLESEHILLKVARWLKDLFEPR